MSISRWTIIGVLFVSVTLAAQSPQLRKPDDRSFDPLTDVIRANGAELMRQGRQIF